MSTDWDVYCLDCQDGLGLSDQNGKIDMMHDLIRAAPAIAGMAGHTAIGYSTLYLQVEFNGPHVDPWWFKKHLDHRLIPRNEYGGFSEDCHEEFRCCKACDRSHTCHLARGHKGKHKTKRP